MDRTTSEPQRSRPGTPPAATGDRASSARGWRATRSEIPSSSNPCAASRDMNRANIVISNDPFARSNAQNSASITTAGQSRSVRETGVPRLSAAGDTFSTSKSVAMANRAQFEESRRSSANEQIAAIERILPVAPTLGQQRTNRLQRQESLPVRRISRRYLGETFCATVRRCRVPVTGRRQPTLRPPLRGDHHVIHQPR